MITKKLAFVNQQQIVHPFLFMVKGSINSKSLFICAYSVMLPKATAFKSNPSRYEDVHLIASYFFLSLFIYVLSIYCSCQLILNSLSKSIAWWKMFVGCSSMWLYCWNSSSYTGQVDAKKLIADLTPSTEQSLYSSCEIESYGNPSLPNCPWARHWTIGLTTN